MKFLILASVLAVGFCDMMVGGRTDQDISDPKIAKEYLDMTFTEFGFDQTEANENVQLVKVQTQVVAGVNTFITLKVDNKICEIDIFDQVWTKTHSVTKNTCVITKRQLGMPGGWSDVKNRNDADVQKALGMVLDRVNQQVNSMFRLVEQNIISLKQQVVAGMKYNITMTVGPSTCMNDQAHYHLTATRCPYDTNSVMKSITVTATVWSKPWENFMQILSYNGQKVTVNDGNGKGSILGGDDHDYVVHGVGSVEPVKAVKVDKQKDLKKPLLGRDNHDYQIHGYQNMMGGRNMGRQMMGGYKMGPGMMNDFSRMGPGMMENYKNMGPDMMNDYKNMGPGMMNNYQNMGPDMMNDYKNMGPDMMNNYPNMGPGMMNDYKNMGPDMMGDYKNDMMPVNNDKPLLGGDTHDYQTHGQKQLGGDTHDYEPHGKPLIGGGTHDYEPHGKPLIGGGTHDYEPHGATKDTGDRFECNQEKFLDFQQKYNKNYRAGKETTKRYKIFCDNLRKARKLQETEKGTATYGATKFADLTEDEFKQYLGKPWHKVKNYNTEMKRADIPKGRIPESFDWREHGAVTAVKNQGSCGSCWAFSTTGNIEGQWAIKKQKLISLSEQELVDCDKLDDGCEGGLPSNAYKEIERLGGLETETEYSYKGEDEKCEFVKKDVKVYINSSVTISSNETEIAAWLAANGPISIGINAFAMQFYFGGISHPWKIFCNPKELDHGVLIVGYGVQGSEPYWIIKNSWGPDWGEKGYYLVYRGAGVCGLNTMCTSSVVN